MSPSSQMDRRDFHKLFGAGIAVFFGMVPSTGAFAAATPDYPEDFHAYLKIGGDGRVTVFSGKIEMGQGAMTSLAQMAAEELGVDLKSVDMVLGDTEICPWDVGTHGSMTSRVFGLALRAAAAKARQAIKRLAASRLGVAEDQLLIESGVASVVGDPTRRISFAELAKDVKIVDSVDEAAALRSAADFEVMGRSAKRLDGVEKVTGGAKYTADIRLPDMFYARILRPPMHGATLTQADTSAAGKLPGVLVVQRDDLVAVLHAEPDAAASALAQIHAQWALPDAQLSADTIFDHILASAGGQKQIAAKGDLATVSAAKSFETIFQKGYVAHAPLEPHAALADVRLDSATVWASTQAPFQMRDAVANALGFESKAVRVITPFLGGGFGGKSAGGQAIEAARLSRACGKPVLVERTRAEEFFLDTFDPASVVKVSSGLDQDGKISRWDYAVFAAGERGASPIYDIPNMRVRSAGGTSYGAATPVDSLHPFAVGPWRGPGANMNVFATESQIDIMAAAVGADPLTFRLKHILDPRMRAALQAAAKAFGWQAAAAPSGRGHGIACSSDAGSCVATMAEVKVDRASGKVTILRIVCAQDMGIVINPEGAKMQIEGGLTMGLGYALSEELHFRGGEILDENFDTYQLPRFSAAPHVETVFVENNYLAPQGCGEPAITTTGAVIANAVFDAAGARMLRLPMTPDRIKSAISALRAGNAPSNKTEAAKTSVP
jgi:nicotinate dehydrogenase subunit B